MENVDNIIINRLASEVGALRARVIQVETYNEILVDKLKEYEAKEAEEENAKANDEEFGAGQDEEVGE